MKPRARRWTVDGLTYEGLEWGRGLPVLALHGWMDHAESFAELAPRLTGCHVVALDLSGQGLSSHRAAHASYNIWDDLPQIAGLLDDMGWADCVLLGHSRGAVISCLFAATQPDRVRALVALDSLMPETNTATVVETLRAYIEETRDQMARPPRVFASEDDYVHRRGLRNNAESVAQAFAHRALKAGPEGYTLRGDRRLYASSALRLRANDVEDVLRALRCPTLVVWGREGLCARRPATAALARQAADLIPDLTVAEVPGDHHFHMDPENAAATAAIIQNFLQSRVAP